MRTQARRELRIEIELDLRARRRDATGQHGGRHACGADPPHAHAQREHAGRKQLRFGGEKDYGNTSLDGSPPEAMQQIFGEPLAFAAKIEYGHADRLREVTRFAVDGY